VRTTTIKVSVETRDRLKRLADEDHLTLDAELSRTLDKVEEARFWAKHGANIGIERSRPIRPRGLDPGWERYSCPSRVHASRVRGLAEAADTIRDPCWQCLDEAVS
jgi:hypothetical protein